MENYIYHNIDLRHATQQELSEMLQKDFVLISFEKQLSDDQVRIAELFAFAEMHKLEDLQDKLISIFGNSY